MFSNRGDTKVQAPIFLCSSWLQINSEMERIRLKGMDRETRLAATSNAMQLWLLAPTLMYLEFTFKSRQVFHCWATQRNIVLIVWERKKQARKQCQANIQPVPSEHATGAKRGKTCNWCRVRENIQPVPCSGKHATGAKRGIDATDAKGGKTCNRCQAWENAGKSRLVGLY